MYNKILLIVDPQIDFITGSLPVPGAVEAMDALASYINTCGSEYCHIIVTADRHPLNHCSFISNGGPWPRHCVADSVGAAIWSPIMEALYNHAQSLTILHKGERADKEEYSIFKNPESARILNDMFVRENIDRIDICGLAGDICVADTLADGLKSLGAGRFNLLKTFSPSTDGGRTLDNIITNNGISCDR